MPIRYELNIVGGAVIIAFGVFMLGLVRPSWLERDLRVHTARRGGHPVAAVFTDSLAVRLKAIGRIGHILQVIAAGIMILMGIAMITGQLSAFAFWLLETFPILGQIG